MTIYELILLQFSAHLLADFTFQPPKWSKIKATKLFSKHHIYHVAVVFILSYSFSLHFGFWYASLILTALHLGADILKSYLQIRAKKKELDHNYFFIDQLIHISVLLLVSSCYACFCKETNIKLAIDVVVDLKTVAIVAGFIFCGKPSNILISNIFSYYKINVPTEKADNEPDDKSLPNAGKLIGVMERFLVLALILINQLGAVGLLLGAKSVLRFKDTQKNEYVLLGTLLSFGIAALIGIAILNL